MRSKVTLRNKSIDNAGIPSDYKLAIAEYICDNELVPKHLIATHAHIDHNFGNAYIYEQFGLKPEVHASDEKLMNKLNWQAESIAGIHLDYEMPPVGKYLTAKDTIKFGNHIFTIIETPGHSPGCVFFYCENEHLAFSGDTLFHNSIGRTDFEGGSKFMIIQSLRIICQLPDNTRIFPGHGEETSIVQELAENPYLDR